jgi:hypothetical protein
MPEAPLSLLGYVRRQFGGDREQKFDFMTAAGDKVTGTFAAWPEPDDDVVVVLTASDRLHVIVVAHLVYIAEHRATDAREALSSLTGKVRDAGAEFRGRG